MPLNPVTNYPNGFSSTVTVLGMPVLNSQSQNAWWVSSTTGLDGNPGTFQRPFATLDRAMSFAGLGDLVMVKEGHAETLSSATALALDIAGVSIIGLGVGNKRPTFTLDTGTDTTIAVSAAGVSITNCRFIAGIAALASFFTLTAANAFILDGCSFLKTSTFYALAVITTDTTSNDADGLTVVNTDWRDTSTSTVSMISMLGTNDNVRIANCYVKLGVSNNVAAVMAIATGKLVTNLQMYAVNVVRLNTDTSTGAILITTNGSTNSGAIVGCFAQTADTSGPTMVTASSGFSFSQNYGSGVNGASGYLLPAADS